MGFIWIEWDKGNYSCVLVAPLNLCFVSVVLGFFLLRFTNNATEKRLKAEKGQKNIGSFFRQVVNWKNLARLILILLGRRLQTMMRWTRVRLCQHLVVRVIFRSIGSNFSHGLCTKMAKHFVFLSKEEVHGICSLVGVQTSKQVP